MLTDLLAPLGHLGIATALIVLGLLSRRLGAATRAGRYYLGFYVAAGLQLISVGAQFGNLIFRWADPAALNTDVGWVLIYSGLPALALTLGVYFAWRYWSWLLAERG